MYIHTHTIYNNSFKSKIAEPGSVCVFYKFCYITYNFFKWLIKDNYGENTHSKFISISFKHNSPLWILMLFSLTLQYKFCLT